MSGISNVFSGGLSKGVVSNTKRLTIGELAGRAADTIAEAGANYDPEKRGRYSMHPRSAMVLTCKEWEYKKRPGIRLYVNPSDMRWSIPRRGTVVKTAGGQVRNTWRNRYKNTYYDEYTISITFQTGNIMPVMGLGASFRPDLINDTASIELAMETVGVPPGLQDFYEFLELIDRPAVIGPYENRHVIIHHSRAFPSIRLEGYFKEDPISFGEVSTDGNRLTWDATFQVYWSYPRLQNSAQMISAYKQWIQEEALSEAIGQDRMEKYLQSTEQEKLKQPATLATRGSDRAFADDIDGLGASLPKQGAVGSKWDKAAEKLKKSRFADVLGFND